MKVPSRIVPAILATLASGVLAASLGCRSIEPAAPDRAQRLTVGLHEDDLRIPWPSRRQDSIDATLASSEAPIAAAFSAGTGEAERNARILEKTRLIGLTSIDSVVTQLFIGPDDESLSAPGPVLEFVPGYLEVSMRGPIGLMLHVGPGQTMPEPAASEITPADASGTKLNRAPTLREIRTTSRTWYTAQTRHTLPIVSRALVKNAEPADRVDADARTVVERIRVLVSDPVHFDAAMSRRGVLVYLLDASSGSPMGLDVARRAVARGWMVVLIGRANVHSPFNASLPGDEPKLSTPEMFARAIDEDVASWVYALEAVIAEERERCEIEDKPVVIFGTSLGALVAPALAARLGEDADAMVLVAGGANVPRIMMSSPVYAGIHDRFRDAGVSARAMRDVARAASPLLHLDPGALGPMIARVPTLLVHADFDAIIPDRFGDLLHERLGRPERWRYPYGHVGLLVFGKSESRRILDWIDAAIR